MMPTLKQYNDRKEAELSAHASSFNCLHADTALKKRLIKGGRVQYVYQCLRCGAASSNPIAAERALKIFGGMPPPFDDSIHEEWERKRNESLIAIRQKFSREDFLSEVLTLYLKTPAWFKRRSLVIKRAHGICEGCAERPATQVHHKTYEHVGAEFLFELIAVCDLCHEQLRSE